MQGSSTAKVTSPGAALRIPGSTPHKLNARYEPVMYLLRQYGIEYAGYQHLYRRNMSLIDRFCISLEALRLCILLCLLKTAVAYDAFMHDYMLSSSCVQGLVCCTQN